VYSAKQEGMGPRFAARLVERVAAAEGGDGAQRERVSSPGVTSPPR
jgi:hypothetical protein